MDFVAPFLRTRIVFFMCNVLHGSGLSALAVLVALPGLFIFDALVARPSEVT